MCDLVSTKVSDFSSVLKGKAHKAIAHIAEMNALSKGNWKDWSESGKDGLVDFVELLVKLRTRDPLA